MLISVMVLENHCFCFQKFSQSVLGNRNISLQLSNHKKKKNDELLKIKVSLDLQRTLWSFFGVYNFICLLLSHFSCVRLCVTPQMVAHQAPPSLGFSRQEHLSGLPFPSPMHESEKWKGSRSVLSDSWRPHGLQSIRLLHPWDFPGKSTGVGCHRLPKLSAMLSTFNEWVFKVLILV